MNETSKCNGYFMIEGCGDIIHIINGKQKIIYINPLSGLYKYYRLGDYCSFDVTNETLEMYIKTKQLIPISREEAFIEAL